MRSDVIEKDMQDIYSRDIAWERFKGKTILVTGATGMLVSYLLYFLIYLNEVHNANIRIIALVRNLKKCEQKFGKYKEKSYFKIYTEDITKPLNIAEAIDFIIHAASLASPQYYEPMPIEVAAPNVLGTYYLLQLAREKKVSGFLFFSSGDIYGKMPEGTGDIVEEMSGSMDPLDMHSCYGESKRMGETWCASFAREYDMPVTIVRIGHTYGPTMDVEQDPRVFASFMKCVYHGEDIVMLSDGSAKRPFCYIADAIVAFFLVLLEGKKGEAYNVCNTMEFLSIAELAELMVRLRPELGLKFIRKQRVRSEVYLENKGNKDNKPIETKLKKLGWKCHYDSYTGFKNVLRYLQQRG
ncbi:MAG: NAD(P)-dependent oxidoreductase [Veillonellales bacterium]